MGLDNLYTLTNTKYALLRVRLVDIDGKVGYGYFKGFRIRDGVRPASCKHYEKEVPKDICRWITACSRGISLDTTRLAKSTRTFHGN